jgi:hypothetical protein
MTTASIYTYIRIAVCCNRWTLKQGTHFFRNNWFMIYVLSLTSSGFSRDTKKSHISAICLWERYDLHVLKHSVSITLQVTSEGKTKNNKWEKSNVRCIFPVSGGNFKRQRGAGVGYSLILPALVATNSIWLLRHTDHLTSHAWTSVQTGNSSEQEWNMTRNTRTT